MALPSTTSDPILEPNDGDVDSQAPEQDLNTEAENQTEDTSQTSDTEEPSPDESDNDEDTEIKDWAAKKNLPLDDPLKIAKMYRESEKQLGKKGQKEGQLKQAVSTANVDTNTDDVQALRNEMQAMRFEMSHPEMKEFEPAMVDILEEKPWLAGDLETVLDVAKGRATNTQLVAERKAGRKEALTSAENAGRAAPPRASANQAGYSSNKITFDNVDNLIAKNGHQWYKDHLSEINAVLAGN